MMIDLSGNLKLRRKFFLHGNFQFLALSLLLSFDISAEDWVENTKRSAEQGDAEAQYLLGGMYHLGNGVPENYDAAINWYRKAAEQGYAEAQILLGLMFYEGIGVPVNYVVAADWYRMGPLNKAALRRSLSSG